VDAGVDAGVNTSRFIKKNVVHALYNILDSTQLLVINYNLICVES